MQCLHIICIELATDYKFDVFLLIFIDVEGKACLKLVWQKQWEECSPFWLF